MLTTAWILHKLYETSGVHVVVRFNFQTIVSNRVFSTKQKYTFLHCNHNKTVSELSFDPPHFYFFTFCFYERVRSSEINLSDVFLLCYDKNDLFNACSLIYYNVNTSVTYAEKLHNKKWDASKNDIVRPMFGISSNRVHRKHRTPTFGCQGHKISVRKHITRIRTNIYVWCIYIYKKNYLFGGIKYYSTHPSTESICLSICISI